VLQTAGFTAAVHERLDITLVSGARRSLVVKRVNVAADWTASRTGDRAGREALLLDSPSFDAVWQEVASPYLAFWRDGGNIGLVMEDLAPALLPDARLPLEETTEDALLGAIASIHARFWCSPVLDATWLAAPHHYLGLLDERGTPGEGPGSLPAALGQRVSLGWAAAQRHMPPSVARLLSVPAVAMADEWSHLPRTLLHGDVKVANFAMVPDGRVAAFDWAMTGAGPCTIDLGWYLGVNASRLARPADAVIARYRNLLARAMQETLPDALWDSLVRVAVITGARMMLWSKALALEAQGAGAREEWSWWLDHLQDAAR